MYNNRNDRNNGADEIMRRLMDITNQNLSGNNEPSENLERSRRSVHAVPEDREMYQNGNNMRNSNNMNRMTGQENNMRSNMMQNETQSPRMNRENEMPMENRRMEEARMNRENEMQMENRRMEQQRMNIDERMDRNWNSDERCGKPSDFCKKMRPGYAYVKPQKFGDLYEPSKALKRGTLFRVLDLPKNVYEMKGEE